MADDILGLKHLGPNSAAEEKTAFDQNYITVSKEHISKCFKEELSIATNESYKLGAVNALKSVLVSLESVEGRHADKDFFVVMISSIIKNIKADEEAN